MRHPEQQPTEVFVTNATFDDFALSSWTTKRLGHVAYDAEKRPVPSLQPMFVERAEIAKRVTESDPERARVYRSMLEREP